MGFLENWQKALGTTRPWDILKPGTERADNGVQISRMNICRSCPLFVSTTQQCSKCLCFMPLKTTLKNAECPERKW